MKPLDQCRLYTFVDTAYLGGKDVVDIARQLCRGGADLIQLRAKNCSTDEIRRLAETILPIAQQGEIGFVVNDHPQIATEVGAPYCHLGQEDFFDGGHTHVAELSAPNRRLRVGLSTHSPEQAAKAVAAGADYIAIGPVYATGTKPAAEPVTLDYVRWAAANVTTPWFAIGGINLQNLGEVLDAGARRICVVSAILQAPDIANACREFKNRLPGT